MDHAYSVLSNSARPNEPYPLCKESFNNLICDFMREQRIPGASLCIYYNGEPWYRQGYGIVKPGQCATSGTYFRIASISKVFTSMGILSLVETGCLTLDSRVFGLQGLLPQFKCRHGNQKKITILHLLQHSAGWDRDIQGDQVFWYSDNQHADNIDVWKNETLIQHVLTQELAFEPGTKHAYSNLTYMLLGVIIEEVTKEPYIEFISRLMRPLGVDLYVGSTLQDDCVDFIEAKYFNNSTSQTEKSIFIKGAEVAPQYGSFPMENTSAYGGLVTCAESLVKILDSLVMKYCDRHILSQDSVKKMKERPGYCKEDNWYGLGLDVEDNGRSFGHTGAMDGTSSTVFHDKQGFTWAVLFNAWAKDMDINGLIKYALCTVQGVNFGKGVQPTSQNRFMVFFSQDKMQCVTIHVPHSALLDHASDMKEKGYIISYISAITLDKEVQFNIVWTMNERNKACDWRIILDLALIETDRFISKIVSENLAVCLCQAYVMGSTLFNLFIVIKEDNSLTQKITCTDEIQHEFNIGKFKKLGFKLICQSAVSVKRNVYITAIFSKIKSTEEDMPQEQMHWTKLPVEDFTTSLREKFDQQYQLNHLQFYTHDKQIKVSASWTKLNISRQAFQRHIVYQHYNVSKYRLLYELNESLHKNQSVKCLCSYVDEDHVVNFVCIWGRYNRVKQKKNNRSKYHCKKTSSQKRRS